MLDLIARALVALQRRMRALDPPSPLPALHAHAQFQQQLASEFAMLQADMRARMPGNPAGYGYKVYSQADEDGILAHVLAHLGPGTMTAVEIGCGGTGENNTHALLLQGWRACWCDGASIEALWDGLGVGPFPARMVGWPALWLSHQFLTRNNAADYLEACLKFLGTRDLDLLSVDIDGNDVAIMLAALTVCQPRVLVVEYNAKFPPPLALTMAYDPAFAWDAGANDDYQGASLQAWVNALDGYRLVACTLSGVNAVFVREDLATPFPLYVCGEAAALYQPARHRLIWLEGGHRGSLRWLRQVLRSHTP